MKNGQIFARKSTARGGLDLEYLDETSRRKVSLRERANMDQQIGRKLKHFTDYAKAFGEISLDRETSRDRSSACVLDVEGTARCADGRGHQP